jgi:branched-chain amino acid transport system ATP-binding protein
MLTVENLSVRHGAVQALRDVSVKVERGELVAVVGPNGAGKSTLLHAIAGRVRARSGTVTFDGTSLLGLPSERIVRLGLGLVPEGRHIFETLTVGENLKLGMMASRGRTTAAEFAELVDERFPILRRFLATPAGRLSGGEQQQLAIARAMAARPDILLLDEPSLGLAPMVVDKVFELIEQFPAQGVSVLLVEQNAHRAVSMADRSYVLKSGRIVLEGAADELSGSIEEMTSAYLGG